MITSFVILVYLAIGFKVAFELRSVVLSIFQFVVAMILWPIAVLILFSMRDRKNQQRLILINE